MTFWVWMFLQAGVCFIVSLSMAALLRRKLISAGASHDCFCVLETP